MHHVNDYVIQISCWITNNQWSGINILDSSGIQKVKDCLICKCYLIASDCQTDIQRFQTALCILWPNYRIRIQMLSQSDFRTLKKFGNLVYCNRIPTVLLVTLKWMLILFSSKNKKFFCQSFFDHEKSLQTFLSLSKEKENLTKK